MDIVNTDILTDGVVIPDSFVRIRGSKIVKTGSMQVYVPDGADVLDARGLCICPGYIDIHNHGAMGYDIMDAKKEAFETIGAYHLAHGVTSYLPTTMTASKEALQKVFDCLDTYQSRLPVELLGVHMEGPFLSAVNAGAQPAEYLLNPDEENIAFVKKNKKHIRLITVSPDVKGIERFIFMCRQESITVSAGHDDAVDTEICQAIEAGVSSVTHLYCCSSGIRRKDGWEKRLGLTQIGLMEPRLFCEVIADGCHVPDLLFPLILNCKGYQKICLVSDAIRSAGMCPGEYRLGNETDGVPVTVTENIALLKGENVFAGSITPISRMVERLVQNIGIPVEQAVYMASGSQAKLLNLRTKGAVQAGYDAQLNVIDRRGVLHKTIIGENIYQYNGKGGEEKGGEDR